MTIKATDKILHLLRRELSDQLRSRILLSLETGFRNGQGKFKSDISEMTIEEFCKFAPNELLGIRNFAIRSLVHIENILASNGFYLAIGKRYLPSSKPKRRLKVCPTCKRRIPYQYVEI